MKLSLRPNDFANLFGITEKDLPPECISKIISTPFNYSVVEGDQRDQLLLEIFKKIDAGEFSLAGKKGIARWEKGWGENLEQFRDNKFDIAQLVPKYIRSGQPLRLFQQYIQPEGDSFELNWYLIFREWLFKTYLSDVDAIYEFGCGSGFNIAALANLFPEKQLFGMDWAKQSVEIVNNLASSHKYKAKGKLFDFFNPDKNYKILPNSAIITIGALEQTGRNYMNFIRYVIQAKPTIVLNIEPTVEWYDPNKLVDYAAIRFHMKRKYWQGFPPALEKLKNQGKVEIIKQKRSFFGSLYLEGYSQSIWRPL
jgi:hypothetical protein